MLPEASGARHQLAAAVGADMLHRVGAGDAERTLEATDLGLAVGGQRRLAALADGSHLQGHAITIACFEQ